MGFKFLAIVKSSSDTINYYKLQLDENLRDDVSRSFIIPANKWMEPAIHRAPFDEAYSLADTEIFEIKGYALPPDLLNAVRFLHDCPEFDVVAQGVGNIKAIVAFNARGEDLTAIFKIIPKAKKLEPNKNLMVMCGNKTYARQTDPGMIIDDRIVAHYENGTLVFRSPSTVKQVLSLKEYSKEANDLEMVAFLEARFQTEPEKILGFADTWMRKRFAALMASSLFDDCSALEIYDTARNFSADIPMQLSQDRTKIVLPDSKGDVKMILKFLNEEYYKGVLTGKDYQTPSKRPLAKAESMGGQPRKQGLKFPR